MMQARELQGESPPAATDSTSTSSSVEPRHRSPESAAPEPESTAPKVTRSSIRRLRTLSRVYLALAIVLFIAVVVLVVLFNQVRIAAIGWEEQAHQNNAAARNLGKDIAELRDQFTAVQGELDTVSDQLVNAQNRLKEQGAAMASTDDRVAHLNQFILQYEILTTKGVATTDLYETCQVHLDQLLAAMTTPELYDPEQIQAYREQVEAVCESAATNHAEFKEMVEASEQGFPDMDVDGQ